ncbi:MAG: hypothetical protein ABFS28_15110 [Bacteroidota bacterium]
MDHKIPRFGTIKKRETLTVAPLDFPVKYQVLYSPDPFPGYYCNEDKPADNSCKTFSYYIPFEQSPPADEDMLCRISLEIQQKDSVDICPALIRVKGDQFRAFRVKEIEPGQLLSIFDLLMDHGLKLKKNRPTNSFLAHIKLKGFFEIQQIEEGVFRNVESKDLYYMILPGVVEWSTFEKLITYQKTKGKFKNFDAAIGYWLDKPSLVDFLRIYGTDLDVSQLKIIRDEFLENSEKFTEQGILI